MHDFVRELTRLRREYAYAFSPSTYGGGMSMSWKNTDNAEMGDSDWSGRSVAIHYYADGEYENEKELFVLINMSRDNTDSTSFRS